MAQQIAAAVEPDSVNAGDSLAWTRNFPDYKSTDGWALSYALFSKRDGSIPNGSPFSATTNGDGFAVTVTAAVTTNWTPDAYRMVGYLVFDVQRVTIFTGSLTVVANPLAPTNLGDTRSHAKKVLDAIEATLEGRALDDILDSLVETTMIKRLPMDQLILMRDRYRTEYIAELAGEKIAKGLGTGKIILTRFIRPS